VGPVPSFNLDLVALLSSSAKVKTPFYIPTDADYTEMLDHLLVVAYGVVEAVALAPEKEQFLAGQSLTSLAHVYERITDFRRRNWFRELCQGH
jgi:hypothetical protein